MGVVLPVSGLKSFLKTNKENIGCIVDTNLLIARTYPPHPFEEEAIEIFEILQESSVPAYANVTIRAEYLEFRRKMRITEAILSLARTPRLVIPKDLKEEIGRIRGSIFKRQNDEDDLPIMKEHEIKRLKKKASFHGTPSGDIWTDICRAYLKGNLAKDWTDLLEKGSINYLDLGTDAGNALMNKRPLWDEMCGISDATCIGTADSMILNFLYCSKFQFGISADYDLAYSFHRGKGGKTLFTPDRMYEKWIKPLISGRRR